MLKEILKKVNRILVELTCIERRLSKLENKVNRIADKEININTIEEAFVFDTISSVDELELFEQNLNNEEFFIKMVFIFIHNNYELLCITVEIIHNCYYI